MKAAVLPAERPAGPGGPLPRRRAWPARAYDSHARLLIRSDTYMEGPTPPRDRGPPYERSTASRTSGKAMRFVSRHVFKRMLPGSHSRRITPSQWRPVRGPSDHHHCWPGVQRPGHHPVVIAFNQVRACQSGASFAVRRTTCLRSLPCLSSARVQGHLQESMELREVFVTMCQSDAKPLIRTCLFSSQSSVCVRWEPLLFPLCR